MECRVGIMQPYFLPYIGYWQLIRACDVFVIYDDIQYTKKGWTNRNRMLVNGHDEMFTLPIKNGPSDADIINRSLADDFDSEKFLRKIAECYRKAPYYQLVFPVIEDIVNYPDQNLFRFLFHSIERLMAYLGISTRLVISSTLQVPRALKGQERVMATCRAIGATSYLNPIGGIELYDKATFGNCGISLGFLKSKSVIYEQFDNDFVPFLSILDIMMFNPVATIDGFLSEWEML